MAHWLWMRFGVSDWKARRWMDAARTLESLPLLSQAFASGEIGIDKVVELTRFATPRDRIRPHLLGSPGLVRGNPAQGGSPRPVPAGDAGCRAQPFAVLVVLRRGKALRTGGRASRLRRSGGGSGPPAGCGVLANEPRRGRCVVGRQTSGCPGGTGFCPDRLRPGSGSGDRGDPRVARGPDLWTGWRRGRGRRGSPRRDGPTLGMLGQAANDAGGREGPIKLGRLSREPTSGMMRALRYRDRECRFPGCGARRFTHAHHITWWERGGKTDLDNLLLVCSFHHRLVHEHGWGVRRRADGTISWFRPDGTLHRAGPGPPAEAASA
jgi:hypothetical protein